MNRAQHRGENNLKRNTTLLRVIRLRYLLRFTGADITLVIGYLLKAPNARHVADNFKDTLRSLNATFRISTDALFSDKRKDGNENEARSISSEEWKNRISDWHN